MKIPTDYSHPTRMTHHNSATSPINVRSKSLNPSQTVASPDIYSTNSSTPNQSNESNGIRDVYDYNLDEEMRKISKLVKKYPYIAIDTEFPGIIARPCGSFNTASEYEYAIFKVNVDLMNIIQLGISFFDDSGNQPSPIHTWQFNFRFNLAEEM